MNVIQHNFETVIVTIIIAFVLAMIENSIIPLIFAGLSIAGHLDLKRYIQRDNKRK